ncbi:MAG: DNA repair protein RecO [Firmicutes bacterium]|nr:DNA repair protein RecO [Bacillota bacterium]
MNLYRVRAVVLNSREMRDAHRVLTLYSRENGKIRAVAHGVNKPSSRKRGAVQPFSFSDFLLRRGRELDTVNQCEGLEVFPALWGDLERMGYAAHATELVDGLTADGEPNGTVFDLLLHTLRRLEKAVDAELVVRGLELRLVSVLGYRPRLDGCVNCGSGETGSGTVFSAGDGGLVCKSCSTAAGRVPCSGETVAVMKLMLDWDPAKLDRLRVSHRSRRELQVVMREYLQWLTEVRPRSLHFLESVRRGSS